MGPGWELPGYDVQELVGFGSTGEVWRAVHVATNDPVALKRVRAGDITARERLRREAALVSSAAGEHVIRVRDVVTSGEESVLVMDFAAGGSLAGVLAVRGKLAAPEVVTLVGPLAGALADAHDRGIVHGDVTPANIVFTTDGRPLLTDFGVARLVGEVGTPVEATATFAAPEVLAGAAPTSAADVYALCRVAAQALDPTSAPAALVEAIEAGLAEDPHERPSARALAMDVLSACAAAPVGLVRAPLVAPVAMTTPVRERPALPAPTPERRRRHRRTSRSPALRPLRVLRMPRLSTRATPRAAAPVLALAALGAAVFGGVVWGHHSESSAATLPHVAAPVDWSQVVQQLDERRALAFATGDLALLDSVYTAGSSGLGSDRTTLLRLVGQAQRVVGLHDLTTTVQPIATTADAATVRVSGRLSSYVIVDRHGAEVKRVAASAPRTFVMLLRRVGNDWRVAAVHP